MSVPPPSQPPPAGPHTPRELVIGLEQPKGLRKLTAASGRREIRLRGSEMTLSHPGVLREPVTLPGGIVDIAVVDRGSASGDHGRFPVLHRMSNGRVIPREHGVEGWLWTARGGSAYPLLTERDDVAPNLALVFVKPLTEDELERWFEPRWVNALAERSPLGTPSVPGLLAAVDLPHVAETAFRDFGVLGDVTDREVPPTHRRHLPTDTPANPKLARTRGGNEGTSTAPPGMG